MLFAFGCCLYYSIKGVKVSYSEAVFFISILLDLGNQIKMLLLCVYFLIKGINYGNIDQMICTRGRILCAVRFIIKYNNKMKREKKPHQHQCWSPFTTILLEKR